MAFNQVLRYLGFTVGSAASPALMAAFGDGSRGFQAALVIVSSLWLVTGLGAMTLDRTMSTRGDGL